MTIHAFTELHNNFPAFINLSEQPDGTIKVSVRTRGNDGKDYATITLTALQAEELADSIYKHNYKGEGEIDIPVDEASRAQPTKPRESMQLHIIADLLDNPTYEYDCGTDADYTTPLTDKVNALVQASRAQVVTGDSVDTAEFRKLLAPVVTQYGTLWPDIVAHINAWHKAGVAAARLEGFREGSDKQPVALSAARQAKPLSDEDIETIKSGAEHLNGLDRQRTLIADKLFSILATRQATP